MGRVIGDEIKIDDFAKLDLRTALVIACEKVEKSDKLLKLQLEVGGATRQVVSGIAQYYTPKEMVGKKVVMVYPIDKWVLMLLASGAEVRNLRDIKWLATEDKSQGKGTGRHIACFVLKGKK